MVPKPHDEVSLPTQGEDLWNGFASFRLRQTVGDG